MLGMKCVCTTTNMSCTLLLVALKVLEIWGSTAVQDRTETGKLRIWPPFANINSLTRPYKVYIVLE